MPGHAICGNSLKQRPAQHELHQDDSIAILQDARAHELQALSELKCSQNNSKCTEGHATESSGPTGAPSSRSCPACA